MDVKAPVVVPDVYVPTTTQTFEFRSVSVVWVKGRTIIHESDPILRGRMQSVVPLVFDYPGTLGAQPRKTERTAVPA